MEDVRRRPGRLDAPDAVVPTSAPRASFDGVERPSPGRRTSDAPRQGIGTFFRNIVDFISRHARKDEVLERVSPETRALFERPPGWLSWVPSVHIDELEAAFLTVAGRDATVEMGRTCSQNLGTTLVQPVLRIAFLLLGQTPASIFGNLDRFFSLVTRGITFSYQATSERSGMVLTRFDGPNTPEAAFHVLQGALEFIFELCGISGEVGPAEIQESSAVGASVRYGVRW